MWRTRLAKFEELFQVLANALIILGVHHKGIEAYQSLAFCPGDDGLEHNTPVSNLKQGSFGSGWSIDTRP